MAVGAVRGHGIAMARAKRMEYAVGMIEACMASTLLKCVCPRKST